MWVTFALSVDGLTVQAAWMAGLALAAIALVGWRKPARARTRTPRGAARSRPATPPAPVGIQVERAPVPLYRSPGPLRRLAAALASGGLAVVTGAVIAIVASFAAAYAVITLTGLLGR